MERRRCDPQFLHSGLLGVVACNATEIGPAPTDGDGRTSVFLTDAPFTFDDIARVDVHVKEIALSEAMDTSEGAPDWVVVAASDRPFNLLDLQNGSTALLGQAQIPPGQYRAVRLSFDPARSTMTDGDGNVIRTAAAPGAPGINRQAKGDVPELFALVEEAMAIDENGEDVVIDFDVGRSFLSDGSGGFIFLPYLRAVTRAGSGSVHGSLRRESDGSSISRRAVSVHIAPDSGGVVGPLLATARSDDAGEFVASLRPERYRLATEDLARDAVSPPTVVEVKAGRTTEAPAIEF